VAVLSDNGIASSGEATLIAFRQRPNTRSFGDATCGCRPEPDSPARAADDADDADWKRRRRRRRSQSRKGKPSYERIVHSQVGCVIYVIYVGVLHLSSAPSASSAAAFVLRSVSSASSVAP